MELDKTAIAITQRNLDELLDLGLSVLRRYGLQLIKPALVGVLPFAILNTLLLWSRSTLGGAIPDPQGWPHILLLWLMGILVYVEAPLAMAGVTIVLGNTMFGITNTPGTVIETLKKQSQAVLWIMGFVRGTVPLIILIALLEFSGINQAYVDSAGMFCITSTQSALYAEKRSVISCANTFMRATPEWRPPGLVDRFFVTFLRSWIGALPQPFRVSSRRGRRTCARPRTKSRAPCRRRRHGY